MVFVWMTTEVSAFCQYSLRVVIVRVTLQELSPNAIATHVTIAVVNYKHSNDYFSSSTAA